MFYDKVNYNNGLCFFDQLGRVTVFSLRTAGTEALCTQSIQPLFAKCGALQPIPLNNLTLNADLDQLVAANAGDVPTAISRRLESGKWRIYAKVREGVVPSRRSLMQANELRKARRCPQAHTIVAAYRTRDPEALDDAFAAARRRGSFWRGAVTQLADTGI